MTESSPSEKHVKSLEDFGPNLETRLIYAILSQDRKPGMMIDVGANVGATLNDFLHSGWQILAVEPDPRNVERLKELFGDNERLTIDTRAVTEKDGETLTLHVGLDSSMTTLSPFHDSHSPYVEVESVTLAMLCQENKIKDVDFLKVDAEGFDFFVLKSIDWTLTHPRIVMTEFEDKKSKPLGYTFQDMCHYMADKGYHILVSERFPLLGYAASNPRRRRKFKPYPCELEDGDAWGDILCFADKKEFELASFGADLMLSLQRRIWDNETIIDEKLLIIDKLTEVIETQNNIMRGTRRWAF